MTREEAIETIRRCCPRVGDSQCDFETAMRELIPELAESEDERIIDGLIGHCKDLVRKNQDDKVMLSICEPWLAWLEKQKEQKPKYCHHEVDLSDCSEEYRKAYYDGWSREDVESGLADAYENDLSTRDSW